MWDRWCILTAWHEEVFALSEKLLYTSLAKSAKKIEKWREVNGVLAQKIDAWLLFASHALWWDAFVPTSAGQWNTRSMFQAFMRLCSTEITVLSCIIILFLYY
jgi:hypothetical protein